MNAAVSVFAVIMGVVGGVFIATTDRHKTYAAAGIIVGLGAAMAVMVILA